MDRLGALLRIEAAAELALVLFLYVHLHGNWLVFVVLFLVPDLGIVGYTLGPRVGAGTYNALHTMIAPALLGLAGVAARSSLVEYVALIWFAHIALDRLLGYGLKYPTRFLDTHLQRV